VVKRVLAIVPDLLIETRIEGAAKGLKATVETVSAQEAPNLIASTRPELVIIDLAAPGVEIEAVASAAREAQVSVAGFYPHVEVTLRRAAKGAGIEHVYARSRFLRDLPAILRERLKG
jgi:AmiR/NasT family two-component response regulator